MAQLPPSAVFGAIAPTDAVHVLFLIENSLPMVEHLYSLQRQLLPSVLGAIRLANPGINVSIFWETTGKTQEEQTMQEKPQRHFNDFPHIDIVGIPRNRLSPLFIRQSLELFLSGNLRKATTTQHVVLVAMSDPIDDPFTVDGTSSTGLGSPAEGKWSAIAESLVENRIVFHLIANPSAKLTKLFDIYRSTLRAQSRQEVNPWPGSGDAQCKCHLSGEGPPLNASSSSMTVHEWPEVTSETFEPSRMLHRPRLSSKRGHTFPPSSHRSTSPDDGLVTSDDPAPLPESASLVTRMQAIHGLAKRRPERSRPAHTIWTSSFLSDTPPKPRERGPAANRERLRNMRPINTGQGFAVVGDAQPPSTAVYTPAGGFAALSSTHSSPLAGPSQTLYQMPSPSSDASSSSSKSPMWTARGIEPAVVREDTVTSGGLTYVPQPSTSLSPQLAALSEAVSNNSTNVTHSLAMSSLTDTGLIVSNASSPSNMHSTWMGPPPITAGNYRNSIPFGVPSPSSVSLPPSFPQSPARMPGNAPVGTPIYASTTTQQTAPPVRAANIRRPSYPSQRVRFATNTATRIEPPGPSVVPSVATQVASASASASSSGSSGPGARSMGVTEEARNLVDGDTPFLFDPVAEAQNAIKLQHAIRSLETQQQQQQPVVPQSATIPQNAPPSHPVSPTQAEGAAPYPYTYPASAYQVLPQSGFVNENAMQSLSYPY